MGNSRGRREKIVGGGCEYTCMKMSKMNPVEIVLRRQKGL
jgi:hypothetical protein